MARSDVLFDLTRRLDAIVAEVDLPTRHRLARELRLDIAMQLQPYSVPTAGQAPESAHRQAGEANP